MKRILYRVLTSLQKKVIPDRIIRLGALIFFAGIMVLLAYESEVKSAFGYILILLGTITWMFGHVIKKYGKKNGRSKKVSATDLLTFTAPPAHRIKRLHNAARVVFYCDDGTLWNTFDNLYQQMKNQPERFDPIILAVPEMFGQKIEHYKALDFLNEKGYPYIKGYNEETEKWIAPQQLDADYVFYNRHYLSRQPKNLSFLQMRNHSKLCYISYAACCAKGAVEKTVCGFNELREFDFLFSENEKLTDVYGSYKKMHPACQTQIVTLGSPKYDAIRKTVNCYAQSAKRQTVLYTPRWLTTEGTCSFFELYGFFFELVRNNPDIDYIFRPHPLMHQGVGADWGEENWNAFIEEFNRYDNAYIDRNPEYFESFAKATVLVTDISSFLFEFLITGKPIIYVKKKEVFNQFGISASRSLYQCTTVDEVKMQLQQLREGIDPLADMRQQVLAEDFALSDGHSDERIMDFIYQDFVNEQRALEKNS